MRSGSPFFTSDNSLEDDSPLSDIQLTEDQKQELALYGFEFPSDAEPEPEIVPATPEILQNLGFPPNDGLQESLTNEPNFFQSFPPASFDQEPGLQQGAYLDSPFSFDADPMSIDRELSSSETSEQEDEELLDCTQSSQRMGLAYPPGFKRPSRFFAEDSQPLLPATDQTESKVTVIGKGTRELRSLLDSQSTLGKRSRDASKLSATDETAQKAKRAKIDTCKTNESEKSSQLKSNSTSDSKTEAKARGKKQVFPILPVGFEQSVLSVKQNLTKIRKLLADCNTSLAKPTRQAYTEIHKVKSRLLKLTSPLPSVALLEEKWDSRGIRKPTPLELFMKEAYTDNPARQKQITQICDELERTQNTQYQNNKTDGVKIYVLRTRMALIFIEDALNRMFNSAIPSQISEGINETLLEKYRRVKKNIDAEIQRLLAELQAQEEEIAKLKGESLLNANSNFNFSLSLTSDSASSSSSSSSKFKIESSISAGANKNSFFQPDVSHNNTEVKSENSFYCSNNKNGKSTIQLDNELQTYIGRGEVQIHFLKKEIEKNQVKINELKAQQNNVPSLSFTFNRG